MSRQELGSGREGHEAKDGLGIGGAGDLCFSLQGKQQICRGVRKPLHFTRDEEERLSQTVPPLAKETDKGDQAPVLFAGWKWCAG